MHELNNGLDIMSKALQKYLPFHSIIIYDYLNKTYFNKKLSECTGQLISVDHERCFVLIP